MRLPVGKQNFQVLVLPPATKHVTKISLRGSQAPFAQDAKTDLCGNLLVYPLMLVNTSTQGVFAHNMNGIDYWLLDTDHVILWSSKRQGRLL